MGEKTDQNKQDGATGYYCVKRRLDVRLNCLYFVTAELSDVGLLFVWEQVRDGEETQDKDLWS